MRLKHLTAVHFRNYERLHFVPHPVCTILCGQNGQGKTNVLEAIGLLATGRSHRGARDRELTYWGHAGYRLDGSFASAHGVVRTVLMFDGKTKRVECDAVTQERVSALVGRTPVSVFAPEDLVLAKGGPGERRRFLDMSLSQVSPSYLADLQVYTRALKQRNRALKDWVSARAGRDFVTVWDQQLIETGSRIVLARSSYVGALSAEVDSVHGLVSQERESLHVRYAASIPVAESVDTLTRNFITELERLRGLERAMAFTPCGPHRDDLILELNGRPLREFGSQGQHRSSVLALKLAGGAILQTRSSTAPITLLDDFASELDEQRQGAVLQTVKARGQVIITTTELTSPLRRLEDRSIFQVAEATLSECAG